VSKEEGGLKERNFIAGSQTGNSCGTSK